MMEEVLGTLPQPEPEPQPEAHVDGVSSTPSAGDPAGENDPWADIEDELANAEGKNLFQEELEAEQAHAAEKVTSTGLGQTLERL